MEPIAHIRTDFASKFGVPRQAGLVEQLRAVVVLEPPYRAAEALRGIEGFSHLWLIWEFSENRDRGWSPTVRPPRLGGNRRLGVFATRSPFRPNPIGLSCVGLEGVEWDTVQGPVLRVSGADLVDGTPILDVKPYLPYTDAHPEASGGFSLPGGQGLLAVDFPPALLARVPECHRPALLELLAQDPRPGYQHQPDRVYRLAFGGVEVGFLVDGEQLRVVEVR